MSDANKYMVSDDETNIRETGLFPIDGKWFNIAFYTGLLVWDVLLMYWALPWEWEDKLYPLGIGTIAAIMIVVHLANLLFPGFLERFRPETATNTSMDTDEELTQRIAEAESSDDTERSKAEREKHELMMLGWVVALPILLYFVGFALIIPIYTFAFAWFFLRDVKTVVLMTVGISVFIWLLFVVLLDVQLWEGTLGLVNPLDYIPEVRLPF